MGEPLSWLKLGPRARTPTSPLAANPLECKASRDSQSCDPRRPGSSRMSSSTPPDTGLESSSTDEGIADLLVRDQDQVWYNPSLDQMVEALQVLLMTHGALEPIPIQYNSYVLHLVEGFAVAQENIRKAEAAYREAKQSLEHNLEQFRLVADDWLERESQYRAEVKRLEVLLSKCSRSGLEAVALARTNSIVDRNGSEGARFLSQLNKLRKDHANDSLSPSTLFITDQGCRAESQENQSREDSEEGIRRGLERVPTPKILDNDNDFRMSEKIRQQDAATKASTTSREGWAHRRGETSQPGLNVMKRYQDGFRYLSADTTSVPVVASGKHQIRLGGQSPTKARVRGKVSIGLSSSKGSHHREDASIMPAISAPDISTYAKDLERVNEAATAKTALPRHERDHSGFSFETGDDFDPLADDPRGEESGFDSSHPTHKRLASVATERHRRCSDDANGFITGSGPSKHQRPPRENGGSATHSSSSGHNMGFPSPPAKPIRGCRDPGYSRHTMIGGSPSQSSHSLDSPPAASATEQETSQRQQAEMDARIAATLALANVLGSTNQKK
ncbi:hypothetical protein F4823DRAFT_233536 [Ustulina deusta]|nr:hypothetical protein F4823DRAFT_233536 [Ustulina deusta]